MAVLYSAVCAGRRGLRRGGGGGGTQAACRPTCDVALQACDVVPQVLRLVMRVLQLHRSLLLCHLEPLALLCNDGVGTIELGLERCDE